MIFSDPAMNFESFCLFVFYELELRVAKALACVVETTANPKWPVLFSRFIMTFQALGTTSVQTNCKRHVSVHSRVHLYLSYYLTRCRQHHPRTPRLVKANQTYCTALRFYNSLLFPYHIQWVEWWYCNGKLMTMCNQRSCGGKKHFKKYSPKLFFQRILMVLQNKQKKICIVKRRKTLTRKLGIKTYF